MPRMPHRPLRRVIAEVPALFERTSCRRACLATLFIAFLPRPGRLDASSELLSIAGSWRDSLDDAEALSTLRSYNASGRVFHPRQ